MKFALPVLAGLIVLFLTPTAAALTQDWGGAEDDWSMPTPTQSGPFVAACYAKAVNDQGCRSCERQYDDNGRWTGKIVCAAVERKASCECRWKTATDCQAIGECTYYP